jgi:hypothetical protein
MSDATPVDPRRIDPASGLPLSDPFPEYVRCPHCGEEEVEVFCYQTGVRCHNCGGLIAHTPPPGCGTYPFCKRGQPPADPSADGPPGAAAHEA